jgi:hypothetical protein
MLNTIMPTRLQAAKVALAATAVTAAAAVGAGVVAPYAGGVLSAYEEKQALISDIRQLTADITLAAETDKTVGLYTAGALFNILSLFGLGDPADALKTLADIIGGPGIGDAAQALIDAAVLFGPVDIARTTSAEEAYARVNNLAYSADALANLIGIAPDDPIFEDIKETAGPMINQRRAMFITESTGGTDAARALRRMIETVQAGSPAWGGNSATPTTVNPGVTAVIALMVRNPSRPSGGVWNLVNPFTSIFGLELMNPDLTAPNYGSFISRDRQQVLNISFTDLAFKYDWVSDIPNGINPFSWLNTAVGAVLPTYLIPSPDNLGAVGLDLLTQLPEPGIDTITTVLDPSGGVGLGLVPELAPLLNLLYQINPEIWGPFIESFQQPGNANYLMYDSMNLPLVEPLALIPRLLDYTFGIDLPTPITNLLTTVLRPLVDSGYNDATVVYDVDGTPSLVRTGDLGEVPNDFLRSPMSATDTLRMPQIVFNAALKGISEHLLSPENYSLTIGDLDLSGLYRNAVTVAIAHALRDVVDNIRMSANPVFNAVAEALEPLTAALDQTQGQINEARYALDNELRGLAGAPEIETPNPVPGSEALRISPRGKYVSPVPAVQPPILVTDPAPAAAVTAVSDNDAPVSRTAAVTDDPAPVQDEAPVAPAAPVSEAPAVEVEAEAPAAPITEAPAVEVEVEAPAAPVTEITIDTPDLAPAVEAVDDAQDAPTSVRDAVSEAVSDTADAVGGGASDTKPERTSRGGADRSARN